MNEDNAIARFETAEDAVKAGYETLLSDPEAAFLYPRNRHERRAKLAELRRQKKREQKEKSIE
jgi:hypothetical protein